MTLAERRRALMIGAKTPSGKIWLYNNGVISPIIGNFSVFGYSHNSTYNKAEITDEYLWYHNDSSGATSALTGGKTFTSELILPSYLIGKTIHVKGQHKNNQTAANDSAGVYVSDSVVNSQSPNTSFVNNINTVLPLATDIQLTDFEFTLLLTKIGFLSLVGRKQSSGKVEIRFLEVWAE